MQRKRISPTCTSFRNYYLQSDGTYALQTSWYERKPGSKEEVTLVRKMTHSIYVVVNRRDKHNAVTFMFSRGNFKPIYLRRVK